METFDLVVVSHLRWSFVWQRPQQLLSRLARHHRILFVEEPVYAPENDGQPVATITEALPNLFVLVPQVSKDACGETPLWLWPCQDAIARQVRDAMAALDF